MELVSREQSWLEASKPQSSQAFQANIFRVCGLAVLRLTVATASSSLRDEPLATARFLAILPNFHLKFPRGHPCLRTLRVELPDIRMPIAVITLKNRTLSPIAQLFIDHVRGSLEWGVCNWHIATNPKAENLRSVLDGKRTSVDKRLGRTCGD